jgi:glutamate dehydrogenase
VYSAQRDPAGALTGIGAGGAPESAMQIAFGPVADPAALARVEAALAHAMADVRAAVTDFRATQAKLTAVAEAMPAGSEREFLHWIGQDHFILLGYRRMTIDATGRLMPEAEGALGLLRDPAVMVFDALADPTMSRPGIASAACAARSFAMSSG